MNSASAEAANPRANSPAAEDNDSQQQAPNGGDGSLNDGLDVAHRFLKRQIAERPLTVLATVLGAGLLLGSILTDRR